MATTIPTFDPGSSLFWPRGKSADEKWLEPGAAEQSRPLSKWLKEFQESLQWKPATPETSRNFLEDLWKGAAEKIGGGAAVLSQPVQKHANSAAASAAISEHLPLLKQTLIEARGGIQKADRLPWVRMQDSANAVPRSFALAWSYLRFTGYDFNRRTFAQFLEAVQENTALEMSEIWSLRPLLQMALLARIGELIAQAASVGADDNVAEGVSCGGNAEELSTCVKSLNSLSDLEWKRFFESVSLVETILRTDPQCAYQGMDSETRESYRAAVADFAAHSDSSEPAVARKAVELAGLAKGASGWSDRARERRAHVGYYLVDAGQADLKREIEYRPPLGERIRGIILRSPEMFYVLGIESVTLAIVVILFNALHVKFSGFWGVAFLLLPALECGVATVNMVATRLVRPKKIPKLDFSKGIPDSCATVVAVPAVLTSEAQVRQAVRGLEIRFLANRDPNLHFALVSDLPDSTQQFDECEPLVELSTRLVQQLDEKYARENKGRIFLFHRHRLYNAAEKLWMGWERKRGKLLDFNRFLLNQGDAFPVKAGDTSFLKNIRYVITLDLDTQLPPGAGHKLVAAMAHPLNRAVIDPDRNTIVEGYGILQPRVDISVKSASRSRFASLLSGETGFDIYTRAVSDVYQDLFGEGIFTGKGIYELATFQAVLEHRFPCNMVLSHDLLEGVYARAGLVSDLEVVDDYPSHFSAFSRRKHRWVRGDWQIIFSLLPQFQNHFGQTVFNPLSYISRWKIFDNLRRSLTEFATVMMLLYGWLLAPADALRWTVAALALLLFPTVSQFLLTVFTAGKSCFQWGFWRNLSRDFAGAIARICFRLAFLCHQSLIDLDAVVRTLIRMKFTHRRLLEWETSAVAESGRSSDKLVDSYLIYSILVAVALGPLVFSLHPQSLTVAMPFLVLWAASAWIGDWLNQPQRVPGSRIKPQDRDEVRHAALCTWRFFREFSNAAENWLIPDIVQADPPLVAHRVSPTNLGLLLNARLAAHDLGYVTTQEFIRDTERTFETIDKMPKCQGHLYNWYENHSLEPVAPRFLSTVDNGNLVASLWTLKQGCLEMIQKPLLGPALWAGLRDAAAKLAEVAAQSSGGSRLAQEAFDLRQVVEAIASDEEKQKSEVRALEIETLIVLNRAMKSGNEETAWWARELLARVEGLLAMLEAFAPWLNEEFAGACALPEGEIRRMLKGLSLESIPRVYAELCGKIDAQGQDPAAAKAKQLHAALEKSIRSAEEFVKRLNALAAAAQSLADGMDFSLLFDEKKNLFSVGFEESEGAISKYNYDLLASEARTAAFVALAKGEVPQESWFRLKRSYRTYKREAVLLSWSGTAFEYLMPCLWLRGYPNTLLERGVRSILRAQQKFAKEHRIPWGISESSCADRNPDGHYRYHAFGVPPLALHRDDCSDDLVVAPYATFLGMMFDFEGSLANLRKLKQLGLLSAYGFYEAVDYTSKRNGASNGHIVVRNWMAHHQGMSLVAAANVLCDSAMHRRFHAEPRVAAIERLLHERQPRVLPYEEDMEAMSQSSPALASLAAQAFHPGLRVLVPKLP